MLTKPFLSHLLQKDIKDNMEKFLPFGHCQRLCQSQLDCSKNLTHMSEDCPQKACMCDIRWFLWLKALFCQNITKMAEKQGNNSVRKDANNGKFSNECPPCQKISSYMASKDSPGIFRPRRRLKLKNQ